VRLAALPSVSTVEHQVDIHGIDINLKGWDVTVSANAIQAL
jgi:hypothetical protein